MTYVCSSSLELETINVLRNLLIVVLLTTSTAFAGNDQALDPGTYTITLACDRDGFQNTTIEDPVLGSVHGIEFLTGDVPSGYGNPHSGHEHSGKQAWVRFDQVLKIQRVD